MADLWAFCWNPVYPTPFANRQEEFLALRDRGMHLAYGQLPLLEIDGLKLVQSQAIVRYVAAKAHDYRLIVMQPHDTSDAVTTLIDRIDRM